MSTFQEWAVEQITNLTTAYNTLVDLKKNINQLDEKTTYETGMYIAVYDPTQSPPKTVKFPFTETALSYATEAYVNNQILNLIDSAPSDLNTLNEIAAAINDDPNFHTTVNNLLALKLNLTGGTLTGTLNGTIANFTGALSASNLTIQDSNNPAMLVLRDTNDSGIFVTAYMSFTGLNNVEQGYVGFTNSANSKLYLHGLDGVQIEGTLYGTDAVFNGNFGIGTNNPNAKLDVDLGVDGIIGQFAGASSDTFNITGQNGEILLDTRNTLNGLAFGIQGATKMVLKTSGNIGIGTNNPTELLDVNGNIKSSGTILPETNNVQTITGSTSSATIGADINVVVVNTSVNCTLTIATTTNISSIKIINIGSNDVSFSAGTGVTINNILEFSQLRDEESGTLTKIATNNWIVSN